MMIGAGTPLDINEVYLIIQFMIKKPISIKKVIN